MTTVGKIGEYDIHRVTVNPNAQKTLLICATMHGDEPAGCYSILEYLEEGKYPRDIRFIVFPLLNPHGFANRTRVNHLDRDPNRAFNRGELRDEAKVFHESVIGERIDFFLSLHEDPISNDFYFYAAPEKNKGKLRQIVKIAEQHFEINPHKTLLHEPIQRGIVYVDSKIRQKAHHRYSIENWVHKHTGAAYACIETPSRFPLQQRVACQKDIIAFVAKDLVQKT